jgi:hypothetical protein
MDGVRTGNGGRPGMRLSGALKPGSGGTRLIGGVKLDQAFTWNGRTCRSDAKVTDQVSSPREVRSTDAEHRGRTARSRVEGAVTVLDRRGCGVQPWRAANQ